MLPMKKMLSFNGNNQQTPSRNTGSVFSLINDNNVIRKLRFHFSIFYPLGFWFFYHKIPNSGNSFMLDFMLIFSFYFY